MSHEDFKFAGIYDGTTGEPIAKGPVLKTHLAAPSAQSKANDLAYSAAGAAYRIRSTEPDPAKWKPLIEAEPEEIRACVREYLKQAYHTLKQREKVETVGKRSSAGDEAMATLAKRYGRV